jgi:AraC-like DNA-binding protein
MALPSYPTMDKIPLHRVAVVRPFTQFLSSIGAPVDLGFRRARLPITALEDVDNYVSSHYFWAFLVDMARREHMEDLGFRVGERFGANCADPKLSAMIRTSPTLYRGLDRACRMINKTVTNCTVGLLSAPRDGYAYFFHSPSCSAENPAIEQIGWYGLMTLLGMVREVAGPHWQPEEIGVMTDRMPNRYILDRFPLSRIRRSQPFSYLTVADRLLATQPAGQGSAATAHSAIEYEVVPGSYATGFRALVTPYLLDSGFGIEDAAAVCETSVRSMQRRLARCGTSYSEVLNEERFNVACRMLSEPGMRIADVAFRLGYSDPTNFSRAFRRIAGIGPRSYRRAHAGDRKNH